MKKIIAVVLTACLLFSGCEFADNTEPEVTTVSETTAPEPQPYPVSVNNVVFEKAPEAIISLSPALTEILYEMGMDEKIVGRSSYCDYPEEVKALADMGSSASPDIDKICAMKPDLVLTSTPIAGKDVFAMEQLGIKTLLIEAPETLEQFRAVYRGLGLIENGLFTGAEAGDTAYSPISKACDNTGVVNIGSFVYITEGKAAATGDTLESAVLSCFGKNLAEKGERYAFDTTSLLENQPDILLVSDIYTYEDIMADETLSQLDAAIKGRIIYLDNTCFERPSGRITSLIEKLIEDYKKLGETDSEAEAVIE